MKKVQETIGRWVSRLGKRDAVKAHRASLDRPTEIDLKSLQKVSGGQSASPDSPNKTW